MKNSFIEKQSKYFDTYNSDIETIDLINIPLAEKIELAYLNNLIGDMTGKKLLDLGCGTGKFGLKLADKADEIVGIDIARHQIEIANQTAEKYGIANFKGVVGDFKDGSYPEYFDFVLAVNVIHHTDDIDLILNNVLGSLKPGGKLVIFEINPLNPLFIPFLFFIGQLKSHLTKEYWCSNIYSLRKMLERNGYKIEQMNKWCFLPTSLYNHSLVFKRINEMLNKIPLVRSFSAFHVIICSKK